MDEADWELLQTRFFQNVADATDLEWDNSQHLFYDEKSDFGYNMQKLNDLNKPTTKLIASHNSGNSKLGVIWFSLVRFHLIHSSVQVPTWWWSKSSFGLIGMKGICIGFIDSGALMGQYQ